jgi:membrane-associated phospholipid phosphatase
MTPFERLFSVMIKPWVAVGFLGLSVLSFLFFDKPLAFYFYRLDPGANWPIEWITKMGWGGMYLSSLLILTLFFRYVYKKPLWEARFWFLCLCVAVPGLICFLLKVVLGRARPELLLIEEIYGFYGFKTHPPFWSFPSGHTTTIMGLVFGLSILFPRHSYVLMLIGLMVAISRLLLISHYLSDIMIASYLALIEVGIIYWWLKKRNSYET